MSVALAAAAFLADAMISVATSWLLIFRLERVGERLGLSEALLGLVAALAADAPEVTAAITAMAGRQPRLGAGVVIGSNVFNLAALLGPGAVVAGRIGLHRRVVVLNPHREIDGLHGLVDDGGQVISDRVQVHPRP
jgi:cation:H+ antiporter